jgi:hypothetical protein
MATDLVNGVKDMANGYEDSRFSLSNTLQFANKLLIHGGNIANWNRTKRKTTPNSSDEVPAMKILPCHGYISDTSKVFLVALYN